MTDKDWELHKAKVFESVTRERVPGQKKFRKKTNVQKKKRRK